MYSMVFLLVLASKISFQGMSNCDTTFNIHSTITHTKVMRCVIKSNGNESYIVRLPISLKLYVKTSACNTLSFHRMCCTSVELFQSSRT